ncbi:uncharacterized protein J4E84_000905 [Alternaria hordeiaustralica]|uniref:uncharacterized protein n=1 Tax=Alternaria hordeiaustralica TaxID=1187925 RepID=UPI0020C555D7|nr:uncharacterized protein J4E84_000905 [Alternaria hordeiaustralica]KAI4697772.1 hypothetical protein J4E84_000905 [Alternaria hordeiaustralica]
MESFDPSSGLVFRESTTASVRSMVPTWTSHSRGRRVDPSKYRRQAGGCDTLQAMALRACVWNVDNMEVEALQWLGWSYASRLYEHIKYNDTLSFRTWSLFQKAFPEDIDRHSRFRVQDNPGGLLPSVVDRLAKLDARTLTFLCIRVSDITIDQLVALNKIETLAVLTLEVGRSRQNAVLSLQMMRDWGRSVGESGAMRSLRVLVINNYIRLPKKPLLEFISSFPGLKLVGIHSPQLPDPAECGEGWGIHSASALLSEWSSSGLRRNTIVQQLYEASFVSSSETSRDATTDGCKAYRSLSFQYAQGSKSLRDDDVAWFIRKQQAERPNKRAGEYKPPPDGGKRRVRNDKKVDMGSLLGSFG